MLHARTIPVLISGSVFIGLDLTSTDRAKRMKGVFLSGRYLFTDFYGTLSLSPSRLFLSVDILFVEQLQNDSIESICCILLAWTWKSG